MSSFLDKNVLVTGGAGGIGLLLVERALQAGAANVIIWDYDRPALERCTHQFGDLVDRVHTYVVDLTRPDQIYNAADQVVSETGSIDILFNNAGMVVGKIFSECTRREIQQVIDLNVLGVIHTTRAFLSGMKDRESGHIVNIASAAALIGNPKMSIYTGSKWAVTGWSESLRLEFKSMGKKLNVTTVQPGYIKTGMFEGVKPPLLMPLLEPELIADKIIWAVRKNKSIVREPFIVKLVPFLKGVMPGTVFDFIAGKLFRVYNSMDTFKGRTPRESIHE